MRAGTGKKATGNLHDRGDEKKKEKTREKLRSPEELNRAVLILGK